MDCSPPASPVHGILQARLLEWVAISFSRGSSQPRDWTHVSCIADRFFTVWVTQVKFPIVLLQPAVNSPRLPVMRSSSHLAGEWSNSTFCPENLFLRTWYQTKCVPLGSWESDSILGKLVQLTCWENIFRWCLWQGQGQGCNLARMWVQLNSRHGLIPWGVLEYLMLRQGGRELCIYILVRNWLHADPGQHGDRV